MSKANLSNTELKALVSLLEDDDPKVQHMIWNKIESLGESVIPFLEDQWDDTKDADLQTKIEQIIHDVQFNSLKKQLTLWKFNGGEDLLTGMYLCGKYHFPDMELIGLEQQIKQLSLEAAKLFHSNLHPYDQIRALNRFFFTVNQFRPNRKNFHSPSNSFLNVVLESRKGNPLTLSVIYLLVANILGIPLSGVNFPNLFILTFKDASKQFYINVYNSGLIFTRSDVDDYLKQAKLQHRDHYFQPCSNIEIVIRNIRNLIGCYEQLNETEKISEMQELLSILQDDDLYDTE